MALEVVCQLNVAAVKPVILLVHLGVCIAAFIFPSATKNSFPAEKKRSVPLMKGKWASAYIDWGRCL